MATGVNSEWGELDFDESENQALQGRIADLKSRLERLEAKDDNGWTVEDRLSHVLEAAVEVVHEYQQYVKGGNLGVQASHLVELSNRVSDLTSWLPGYEWESGTMPWERDEV